MPKPKFDVGDVIYYVEMTYEDDLFEVIHEKITLINKDEFEVWYNTSRGCVFDEDEVSTNKLEALERFRSELIDDHKAEVEQYNKLIEALDYEISKENSHA